MNLLNIDYTKELEPISIKWYLKGLGMGLLTWIPFAIFAGVVPIIGWIFLPLVPFWPFVYPFVVRMHVSRKQAKLREQEIVMARAMKRTKTK